MDERPTYRFYATSLRFHKITQIHIKMMLLLQLKLHDALKWHQTYPFSRFLNICGCFQIEFHPPELIDFCFGVSPFELKFISTTYVLSINTIIKPRFRTKCLQVANVWIRNIHKENAVNWVQQKSNTKCNLHGTSIQLNFMEFYKNNTHSINSISKWRTKQQEHNIQCVVINDNKY